MSTHGNWSFTMKMPRGAGGKPTVLSSWYSFMRAATQVNPVRPRYTIGNGQSSGYAET